MKDKWTYNGKNSKGEIKFRRETGQNGEEVLQFLTQDKQIDPRDIAVFDRSRLVQFFYKGTHYQYFWTTGRWNARYGRSLPKKHYNSRGIQDLFERFLDKEVSDG